VGGNGARVASSPPARPAVADVEPSTEISADRRVLTGLPVVALGLLGALAAAAIPATALRSSFDPRTLRSQDVNLQARVSPLASVYREVTEPPRPLFQVEIGRLSDSLQVPRVRLATLERFDGATWSSSAEYARVGTVLPPEQGADVPTRQVAQTFTIEELSGPWLPAADRPSQVRLGDEPVELGFDRAAGTLIAADTDLSGLTYQITSDIPLLDSSLLTAAQPPSGDRWDELTALPQGAPPIIADLAQRYAGRSTSPYERLTAVADGLRADFAYSEAIEPGSSYGHVSRFLSTRRRGYAEQFATSFALMARSLGYPSRLSVGYLTVELGEDGREQGFIGEVTTRQAHVWPEVYFDGVGWVPFEPTPARVPGEEPPPPSELGADQASAGLVESEPEQRQVLEPTGDQGASAGGASSQVFMLGVLVAVVAVVLGGLIGAKALLRRRRLRRAVTPAQRVLGAWSNLNDRLLEIGVPLKRSMTAREVVHSSAPHVPAAALQRLGRLAPVVTAAVFAPTEPSDERVTNFEADSRAIVTEVLASRSAWQRCRAALSPKPLVYTLNARRLTGAR
jgi:transglutaminase-like putative cysteine protease